jgi:8-oxo-dGTP pyrophosphatase MutT (NUDIX family)
MNIGETLEETAVREVFEETGLKINKDQVSLLSVYESVFPVLVTTGPPSDHHIQFVPYLFSHTFFGVLSIEFLSMNNPMWTKRTQIHCPFFCVILLRNTFV